MYVRSQLCSIILFLVKRGGVREEKNHKILWSLRSIVRHRQGRGYIGGPSPRGTGTRCTPSWCCPGVIVGWGSFIFGIYVGGGSQIGITGISWGSPRGLRCGTSLLEIVVTWGSILKSIFTVLVGITRSIMCRIWQVFTGISSMTTSVKSREYMYMNILLIHDLNSIN